MGILIKVEMKVRIGCGISHGRRQIHTHSGLKVSLLYKHEITVKISFLSKLIPSGIGFLQYINTIIYLHQTIPTRNIENGTPLTKPLTELGINERMYKPL